MGNQNKLDSLMTRRGFVGLVGKGFLIIPIGGLIRFLEPKEKILRPPGAVPEEEFLALCTRCGRCLETCPRIISLVPLTESIIAVGTPRLYFNCARCMRCNDVCPTGALRLRR
jgi:epoxyqueuosine reductase QueG